MLPRLPFSQTIRAQGEKLGPGTRTFLKSLSLVSLGFALSKIFSSIATVIMARYLGKQIFGEASVVLLLAQVACPLMLFGLHMSVMRFGAGKKNTPPYIATSFTISLIATIIISLVMWAMRAPLERWMDLDDRQIAWAIALAILIGGYTLFTHFYQTLNFFKQRGMIEVALGIGLLPGLALGYWLTGRNYQTMLITYTLAYGICLPVMIWRFRRQLSPRYLWAAETWDMLKYGGFACFGGVGFILTFVVQPLQLNFYVNESNVGIYRVYSASSINLATFATTIFYTVFFPKVAASQNQGEIWKLLTKAWVRGAAPLFVLYASVFSATVWLSGEDYPLTPLYVLLFSLAATLITVQTTYGQMAAAQGIAGMRWVVVIGVLSGILNMLLSWWLIPIWGITGAVVTLIINFSLALLAILALRNRLYPQPVTPGPEQA